MKLMAKLVVLAFIIYALQRFYAFFPTAVSCIGMSM
jgi:hypothetical protein